MVYDPARPLVFQHIPKCAGTSVRRIFSGWFGAHLYSHYFDNRNSSLPQKIDLAEASERAATEGGSVCVFGHFNASKGYGYRDYYPGVGQILTIIRDPFDHHLSNYYFAKKKIAAGKFDLPLARIILDEGLSIEDYLSTHRSYLGSFLPVGMTPGNYKEKLREEFLFIGVTDRLDESILSLAKILGKPKVRVPRENVSTPDGADSTARYREMFERENEFVTEIFRECHVIFEERRCRSAFEKITSRFRRQ
jgi:hypothetical protein